MTKKKKKPLEQPVTKFTLAILVGRSPPGVPELLCRPQGNASRDMLSFHAPRAGRGPTKPTWMLAAAVVVVAAAAAAVQPWSALPPT